LENQEILDIEFLKKNFIQEYSQIISNLEVHSKDFLYLNEKEEYVTIIPGISGQVSDNFIRVEPESSALRVRFLKIFEQQSLNFALRVQRTDCVITKEQEVNVWE
jgi:hypothetical protein